ncbi:hypothetical protein RvY_13846 [Ramazzottius varieornatus]|uniref:Uncharacterized protein n=1 Tax=Ramazzottius varieornatus TaxID=947166 RepID=A0A1D1VPA2_RAMVA|nr:hypothetical protein RvY_13846 [Ramazzottius varieornatus]
MSRQRQRHCTASTFSPSSRSGKYSAKHDSINCRQTRGNAAMNIPNENESSTPYDKQWFTKLLAKGSRAAYVRARTENLRAERHRMADE